VHYLTTRTRMVGGRVKDLTDFFLCHYFKFMGLGSMRFWAKKEKIRGKHEKKVGENLSVTRMRIVQDWVLGDF